MKFFAIALCILISNQAAFSQLKKGRTVPELTLPTMQGDSLSLSSLRGKVVLIDFWASWCVPCRMNNPRLVALYEKYHSRGLEILGISLDENPTSWKEAVRHDGLPWIQVNDNKGWKASSTFLYEVDAIPSSFLVDKNGALKARDLSERKLETELNALLP